MRWRRLHARCWIQKPQRPWRAGFGATQLLPMPRLLQRLPQRRLPARPLRRPGLHAAVRPQLQAALGLLQAAVALLWAPIPLLPPQMRQRRMRVCETMQPLRRAKPPHLIHRPMHNLLLLPLQQRQHRHLVLQLRQPAHRQSR